MERLAHAAAIDSVGGGYQIAIAVPENPNFNEEVMRRQCATYNPALRLFLFARVSVALRELIYRHYRDLVCPICFCGESDTCPGETPCWYWRRHSSWESINKYFFMTGPMLVPETPEAEERILRSLHHTPAIIGQLTQASAHLRSAMDRTEAPRPTARPRARPTVVAPTIAATSGIRCTACGQVIPPGFDKSKDKKTEDEVYAECPHDFDEQTKICKKCHMAQRETSRFSLLEVD